MTKSRLVPVLRLNDAKVTRVFFFRPQARENAGDQVVIGFRLVSDWLRS